MSNLSPIRPIKKLNTENQNQEQQELTLSGMFSSKSSGSNPPGKEMNKDGTTSSNSLIELDKPFLEDIKDNFLSPVTNQA